MAGAGSSAGRGTPGRRGGPLDRLADLIGPVVERVLQRQEPFRAAVDDKLDEALRAETVEVYLSRTAALGLTLGLLAGVVGTLGAAVLVVRAFSSPPVFLGLALPPGVAGVVETLKLPFLVGLGGVSLSLAGFLVGAGVPLLSLYYEADDRRREIEMLLPDTVAYMYALSVGGMNQLEIFDAVADSEDVYGEVSREFQAIMQETRYFDTDYRTAIRHRAIETPSDSLSELLTDTLSIVDSGGDMTQFLDDKTEKHLREARQSREENLETLELLGEMYMTVSLFPLLLVILLVVMSMMGNGSPLLLLLSVYGLVPGIAVVFVTLIAIVKQDERGGGRLSLPGGGGFTTAGTALERSITRAYTDGGERQVPAAAGGLFDRIHRREGVYRAGALLARPTRLFVRHPTYTLALTVPLAALAVLLAAGTGVAPTTWAGLEAAPVLGTTLYVYVPLYVLTVPLALARYRQRARHRAVLDGLAESLRKLSSANDTGLPLLDSFRNVADTTAGRLAEEFDRIHGKVLYGASLKAALFEFNNRYEIPRMARTVNLIAEAQEASSQISDVLRTAAQAAENQDEIQRERRTRTRMQIAIIVMTYLVLLAVMAMLKLQFLDSIASLAADAGAAGGGAGAVSVNVDIDRLSMLFFHTVTLQAISAAIIAGYLRESRLLGSVKYLVALPTVALAVWLVVG
jgi:flagellar protein FlaJ